MEGESNVIESSILTVHIRLGTPYKIYPAVPVQQGRDRLGKRGNCQYAFLNINNTINIKSILISLAKKGNINIACVDRRWRGYPSLFSVDKMEQNLFD